MVDKTTEQRRHIEEVMDAQAVYHPDIASLTRGLKPADAYEVRESILNIPLREYLAKSGTTGIAGGAYLVPAKLHSDLIEYSLAEDLAPHICSMVINGWEGANLDIDVANNVGYKPHVFVGGATLPTETIETKKVTLTPVSFGIHPRITNDMVEDAQSDIMGFHLKMEAQAMARFSNEQVLTVLQTATDGWGTLNSSITGDGDQTKWTAGTTSDVRRAILGVGQDRWIPNTMVCTQEAWSDVISTTGAATVIIGLTTPEPVDPYFTMKCQGIDIAFSNADCLHLSTDALGTFTDCVTLIFDRKNAILTGRKRWMMMKDYADPTRDIAAMTITARQDTVSLYNDAVYKLYET